MQAAECCGKMCLYYGNLQRSPLYSIQMRESTDQNIFVTEHFSRCSDCYDNSNTAYNTKKIQNYIWSAYFTQVSCEFIRID